MNPQLNKKLNVGVVVLGDIGRSPRMLYHSYSLNREGYNVKIFGYHESPVSSEISKCVELKGIPRPPNFHKYFIGIFSYILKALWQTFTLFWVLLWNSRLNVLLVQNAPAVPTLAVCWLYCYIFRSKLIIDWHNYSYTILGLSLGPDHPLVRISEKYERFFGPLAHHNICVTKAMEINLKNQWNVNAITLYDRPGPSFKPDINDKERLQFYTKLSKYDPRLQKLTVDEPDECPGLLVSSTSWTEDEDFTILFQALVEYDNCTAGDIPGLICVITGKGPLKQHYETLMSKRKWSKVDVVTLWLEPEEYPIMLTCADLGVCLHKSTSMLDLPMKVVDMFGSGLPVCAYKYPCITELVQHNKNGFLFENATELANQIKHWFTHYPHQLSHHEEMKKEVRKFTQDSWHPNWRKNVLHLFR